MILIILPTLLLAVIAWAILVVIKRRKLASICDRLRRSSAAAPPAHEPTPLSPSTLASIEASNLKMMGMMPQARPSRRNPPPLGAGPRRDGRGRAAAAARGGAALHRRKRTRNLNEIHTPLSPPLRFTIPSESAALCVRRSKASGRSTVRLFAEKQRASRAENRSKPDDSEFSFCMAPAVVAQIVVKLEQQLR